MTGLPVAVCPPHSESWNTRDYSTSIRLDRKNEISPFLTMIDRLIDLVIKRTWREIRGLEERLKPQRPGKSQIVLADRMKLAQSPAITNLEITVLLEDPNPLVRMELAWNDSIDETALIKLLRDRNSSVSNIARVRLSSLLQLTL